MEKSLRLDRDDFLNILNSVGFEQMIPVTVTGTSMTPFLLHGLSRVYIEKRERYFPKRGDILFYKRADGKLVLHRVYRVKNGVITTNGDAQNWTETISESDILAQVVLIQRKKKIISADAPFYRVLTAVWKLLKPIRPFCLKLLSAVSRIKKFFKNL